MPEQTAMTRVVVKVGSSVLTGAGGRLEPARLQELARQLAACAEGSRRPVLVSSGAVACGMARLGLARRPMALAQLQACAAIGQGELMHLYTEAFAAHGITVAQVLLTQEDFVDQERFRNAKQTLLTLLHKRVLPIVNENDTVAVDEIAFGDNDRLAALVASAIDAQLLVLLSDVDGFLKDGRVVERVASLKELDGQPVAGSRRQTTRGGMASKLEAAKISGHSGIPMVIANGTRSDVLTAVLAGQPVGTLFIPPRDRLTPRKWRIAFSLRQPRGSVVVDPGAARALQERRSSLLASGVRAVRGRFAAGAFITVVNETGQELGRGVTGFSSEELQRIHGTKSAEAARLLGRPRVPEVIHRDALVLTEEWQT